MKKIITWFFVIILSATVFILGSNNKRNIEPNILYQVYLDDQILGIIEDENDLYEYIDKEGTSIKKKYGVKSVNAPNGLNIKKLVTYNKNVDDVKKVYERLKDLKPFTIAGYQFNIKTETAKEDGKTKVDNNIIYVTDDKVFEESIKNTVEAFVGEENYQKYLDGTQSEIKETGVYYNSVYVDNVITIKKTSIPVNEKIYTDKEELSQNILFSTTENKSEYIVEAGDTIEKVAEKNRISVQEFLVSNPEFTSTDNILYPGQSVSVAYADPMVDVVSDVTDVSDQTSYYTTEERTSNTMVAGSEEVIQTGENGIDRVEQKIKYKNGFISGTERIGSRVIKPTTNRIVVLGTKYISGVGGKYWTWPTTSTSLSSPFGWRSGGFHTALDITNYYGAPIYAANNGIVTMATYGYGTYGIFVAINHNNGYGTAYAHMSSIAPGVQAGVPVERGQLIGYVGLTGVTSGSHLHFEIYSGSKHPGFNYGAYINPALFY